MKRIVSIFTVALLLFGITVAANTGDLRDWMDNLGETPFGYSVSQKITVDQIAVDKIVFKSPVVQDEFGNKIKKYTVMFSLYPMSQMLENTTLIDQAKEKTFEFTTVGTDITMELKSTTDAVNPSLVYYVSVIPKDENGVLGEISNNELRFKLATKTYGEGTPTETAVHAAAGADMSLAHITSTLTSNRATLRWTAVDGSDKVDLFLVDPTTQVRNRLASVNMTDETYTFTVTRNGEHTVVFQPDNGGTEYRYTFTASGITSTTSTTTAGGKTNPVIGKLPATGPKENILITLAIASVLYFVYRRMKAKN